MSSISESCLEMSLGILDSTGSFTLRFLGEGS